MAYLVKISDTALNDAEEYVAFIREHNQQPHAADQLHYHSHRIIFHLDESTSEVTILRVYHGFRKQLEPNDAD